MHIRVCVSAVYGDDVIKAVLSAATTGEIACFSSQSIMVAYPRLFLRSLNEFDVMWMNSADQNSVVNEVPSKRAVGSVRLWCFETNKGWSVPCGNNCPKSIRAINECSQVRMFAWSEMDIDWLREEVESSYRVWQVNRKCWNKLCPFSSSN